MLCRLMELSSLGTSTHVWVPGGWIGRDVRAPGWNADVACWWTGLGNLLICLSLGGWKGRVPGQHMCQRTALGSQVSGQGFRPALYPARELGWGTHMLASAGAVD